MIKNMVLIMSFFTIGCCFSQDTSNLIDAFEDYSDLSREQIYIHLNKSTYITGEMLGFNTYVFLKDIKEPSTQTANVYCQILDSEDNVLAEKMIMMNQGFSRGDFMIDSTYVSGEYKFKSYTNWNKNFANEQNYFLENFRVINPNDKLDDKPTIVSNAIDIQVLPESGHLLAETFNVVGVIAKDQLGFRIPNLEFDVLNDKDEILSSSKLNNFGIGKFLLKPLKGEIYRLEYFYNNQKLSYEIPKAESLGIILSVSEATTPNSIALTIKTNDTGFNQFGDKQYKLLIHNGSEASAAAISFNGKKESVILLNTKYLYPGINILTLFDDKDKPIAERLYFNFEGIPLQSISKFESNPIGKDSLGITAMIPLVDLNKMQNLSISVLPSETKSYNHHQNIISSTYLQPHLKSAVEHASYYFTDITEEKKYELDNLLLTQGWSSYELDDHFQCASRTYL